MKHKLYLVAVSGDCSAQGICSTAEVIPVNMKHKKIIKQFLMAKYEQDIELRYWKPKTEFNQKYLHNYYKCFEKLKDVGIFDNKYQARTDWELMFTSELEELDYKYKIKEIPTGDWFDDHVIIMGLSDKNTKQLKEKLKQEIIK
tara:strand:- start:404 stop:835 length:432 start_codon:yes stop_codon:yes gene_type:complete